MLPLPQQWCAERLVPNLPASHPPYSLSIGPIPPISTIIHLYDINREPGAGVSILGSSLPIGCKPGRLI